MLCGPSLLSRAPWELSWGWVALGFLGNSREEPGNTSSGRKAAAEARELEGWPGQAGARHCLCYRPVFLPLGPPCATQFGHKQLLVQLFPSYLSVLGLALRCLSCRICALFPLRGSWGSLYALHGGCVLAHMGILAPGVQWPPGRPGPTLPWRSWRQSSAPGKQGKKEPSPEVVTSH